MIHRGIFRNFQPCWPLVQTFKSVSRFPRSPTTSSEKRKKQKDPETLKCKRLPEFAVDDDFQVLHARNFSPSEVSLTEGSKQILDSITAFTAADPKTRLTSSNYVDIMKWMTQMDDETQRLEVEQWNLENVSLFYEDSEVFSVQPEEDHNRENLLQAIRDRVIRMAWIVPMEFRSDPKARVTVELAVRDGKLVGMSNGLDFVYSCKYSIHFISNRIAHRMRYQALNICSKHNLHRLLFPETIDFSSAAPFREDSERSWQSDLNEEQKMAVRKIFHHPANAAPFILMGPPGTGKTKTLVEAICQIVLDRPESRILVCAMSNWACNEISTRLRKFIDRTEILRMYSGSIDPSTVPDDILEISNLSKAHIAHYGSKELPSLEDLLRFKVLASTLTIAGRLTTAEIPATHFDYVFIDECASATEPSTLIAIAGVCSALEAIHAKIIFAGDTKQLGPVVPSSMATKMGFGVSFMERLMQRDLYNQSGQFISHLVKNYRSHPAILGIFNELFYENQLQAKAPRGKTHTFIGTALLPSPEFPIIFASTQGDCEHEPGRTSLFNLEEVDAVVSYLSLLLGHKQKKPKLTGLDIGIISPYKAQCEILSDECRSRGWRGIEIGSVETFQGKEKPIIIVSTVRSNMKDLGFLVDPQRLNVLLSRPKSLLIIVGDPFTLRFDANWRHVIEVCIENDAIVPKNQVPDLRISLSELKQLYPS